MGPASGAAARGRRSRLPRGSTTRRRAWGAPRAARRGPCRARGRPEARAAAATRRISFESLEPLPEAHHGEARGLQRADGGGRDVEVALGAAAALGQGIADAGPEGALGLETVERGVERAARDFPSGLLLDLLEDRHGVGVVSQPEDGQEDDLLEFAEVNLSHMTALQALYDTRFSGFSGFSG